MNGFKMLCTCWYMSFSLTELAFPCLYDSPHLLALPGPPFPSRRSGLRHYHCANKLCLETTGPLHEPQRPMVTKMLHPPL